MKNKGFTLVEVLAVLIILGALFAIAVPGVVKNFNNMKSAGKVAEKNLIENAAYIYYQNHLEEMSMVNRECYLKIDIVKDQIDNEIYQKYKDYNIFFQSNSLKKSNPIVTVTKKSGSHLCTS